MDENAAPSSPPLRQAALVVTRDVALQDVLADLLIEGGYTPYTVSSFGEAQELAGRRAFAIILAELFVAASPSAWDDARALLRRVHPAPVGLLVTRTLAPDTASWAGFAFVQEMPFEIDELLDRIASATACPLTLQQQRWAAAVERYCAALSSADWEALVSLLSDDIRCYPPVNSRVAGPRTLAGRAAVRAYYEAEAAYYRRISCTDLTLYPRSDGLTARYTVTWIGLNEQRYQATTTLRLRFDGERIRQMSLRVNPNGTSVLVPARPA